LLTASGVQEKIFSLGLLYGESDRLSVALSIGDVFPGRASMTIAIMPFLVIFRYFVVSPDETPYRDGFPRRPPYRVFNTSYQFLTRLALVHIVSLYPRQER